MKRQLTYKLAAVLLIGLTFMSCKEGIKQEPTANDTIAKGKSILIKSSLQKQEWEKFKINLDSTINVNDIRIAELKLKMQNIKKESDTTVVNKIKVLEKKNQLIKTKLADFKDQKSKDWDSFKLAVNKDLKDLELTIDTFTFENN